MKIAAYSQRSNPSPSGSNSVMRKHLGACKCTRLSDVKFFKVLTCITSSVMFFVAAKTMYTKSYHLSIDQKSYFKSYPALLHFVDLSQLALGAGQTSSEHLANYYYSTRRKVFLQYLWILWFSIFIVNLHIIRR